MIFKEKHVSQMSLSEHFFNGIHRESKALLPPLSDEAVQYLTHLLVHFSDSHHLFNVEDGRRYLPTLALLYESAYNAPTSHQRNSILRQLGDNALFIGALFFEHFSRKGINKDYFVGMGGGAYSTLGDVEYGDTGLFYELGDKFPKLLQVVARVCSVELNYNSDDIFALLERWQRSKDATLRKQLHAIGIVPFEFDQKH